MAKKPNSKLSDPAAKKILCQWPIRSKTLFSQVPDEDWWLRVAPKSNRTGKILPKIHVAGSHELFTTHPDGMYALFHKIDFVDLVCIEVCGTLSNLNDKRSRFASTGTGLMLTCRKSWIKESISLENGEQLPHWKLMGLPNADQAFPAPDQNEVRIPIRFLRILYALPDKSLYKNWAKNHVPAGHEYFCPHSWLERQDEPPMTEFLQGLSLRSHFLLP